MEIDLPNYFYNLALIRQTAKDAGVPFMNTVQAVTYPKNESPYPRLPNTNELRFLNYTTLAYGGQGIAYWKYYPSDGYTGGLAPAPDGTPTSIYTAVKSLNPEFLAIAKQFQFQSLESIGAYHLGDQPPGTVRLPGGSPFALSPTVPNTNYVTNEPVEGMLIGLFGPDDQLSNATVALVVNLDYENSVTTTVNGPGLLSLFNLSTGTTWTPTGQSSVLLNLPPGGGALVGLTSTLRLLGDFDNDGEVTLTDYGIMRAHWLSTDNLLNENGEVTGDGVVNLDDFNEFKRNLFVASGASCAQLAGRT